MVTGRSVLKTVVPERVSGVRIPLPPPVSPLCAATYNCEASALYLQVRLCNGSGRPIARISERFDDPQARKRVRHRRWAGRRTPLKTRRRYHPDGRWLAYTSTQFVDVTGRANVFVVRFPEGTGRTQITAEGAGRPFWSRDSRELYFGAPPGVLQAVSIATGDTLRAGAARTLFPPRNLWFVGAAPDGRLLAFREPPIELPTEIIAVQNRSQEPRPAAAQALKRCW